MPSSHNCFSIVRILFLPIRSISWVVFISWSSKGHHFRNFLRSKFSVSFSNYSKLMSLRSSPYSPGASFKWSLISRDLFILMYLNPLKYLHSFSNSSRWIVPLLHSFSILMVVSSRFLFLRYHINSFVLSSPTGDSLKTVSSLRYISLNPFYGNK